ncbi:hypothetical protein PANA5342_2286 [Pantoea ananatis LMG 5342]|nr:hypothetical protein PANA5342_2286 [Pantoea ananatis LMG 5342]
MLSPSPAQHVDAFTFFSAVSNILLAHSSTSSQTCVYH